MSLRVKALLSSIAALLGLIAVIYITLQLILPSSFARLDEQTTRQGQVSATYLMWALVVIGVAFTGIAFIVVDRLFLAPITGLSQVVRQIGARGDPARRVSVLGNDELSTLASGINEMLEGVQQSQHARHASEERFRALIENSSDLILVLDRAGAISYASPSLHRILGYQADETLTHSVLEFIHPDDHPIVLDAIQHRLANSGSSDYHMQVRVRQKNGSLRLMQAIGSNLLDNPAVAGIVINCRDVTERQRAEDALRASEENYRRLFENATIGIFHSLPEGKFLRVNPALARMLGYASPEEMVALVTDISTQIYVDSRRRGDLYTATLEQSDWVYAENRYRRKDGGIIIANLAVRKVLDTNGAVAYLEGFVEDVTERQRAEEALRESEKRFRIVFEQAAVGVVLANSITGEYFQINQKHCDIVGYTREEMLRKRFQDITYPDDLQSDLGNMKLLLEGKISAFSMEKRYIHKDGSIVWVNLTVSPMWQPGEAPNYHIAIVEDITERKRAQAALEEYSEHLEQMVEARTRELRDAQEQLVRQERLAVLGQLAGGIAHELRSPLGAIKNAAYYFKMVVENPSPDAREMMEILDQQTDVSARIIGSLLDFAGPKTPNLQPAQLARVIEAAICQCTIPQNIAVVWQADESLPSIKVDAGQMQLVFSNLITNAAQAMPHGGQLTIAVQPAGNEMRVTFNDTGEGIAAEALDKVFQPLYTTKAKGIGLGLALTRIIVEAHGGAIAVMSEVGKGTTFTVDLPINAEK